MHINKKSIASALIALTVTIMAVASMPVKAQNSVTNDAQVKTSSAGLVVKVAPGEVLPVSVKLSNFGGGQRVDVQVKYEVTNSKTGAALTTATDTVAVETTSDHIKTLQVPSSAPEGEYTIKTSIAYRGQVAPASTSFTFTIETKILGVFKSSFILYASLTAILCFCLTIIVYNLVKRSRRHRYSPIDYSNIPRAQRVFYELVSDTVMNMRQQVGTKALDIAASVEGLTIDAETGRVMRLIGSPSKIVADLVSGYEKTLGKKVSFAFRRDGVKPDDNKLT